MATSTQCHQNPDFVPGSTAQYYPPSNVQGQSQIKYFLTRNNGTPVPLIPADELPYTVKLQHVPRVLTPDQTYGLNYIGSSQYTGTTFKLENSPPYNNINRFDCQPSEESMNGRGPCSMVPQHFQAPDNMVRQAFGRSNNDSVRGLQSVRPISAYETSKSWRRSDSVTPPFTSSADSSDAAQNAINAILRSQAGAETAERIGYRTQNSTTPPSGKVPDQEKKEWCTYWILHGDCAYVQQGCRYRHEMPDKAKLAEIGINHVPRWWLEQNSAVKLGGGRATLGPVVKPELWLKARKGSDADSESSSTDSAVSSHSEQPMTPPKTNLKPVSKPESPTQSPSIVRAQPATPTELLINFAPLVPTVSTSTSSLESAISNPSSSEEKVSKRSSPTAATLTTSVEFTGAAKATSAAILKRSPSKPAAKTAKVFVPAGESPEVHIADAKKRAAAARNKSRTPSPTITPSKTGENLEKLIREMRKAKSGGPAGLSSSIHAPAEQSSEPTKRKVRTGCRERRPVSSSPPTVATVAKK